MGSVPTLLNSGRSKLRVPAGASFTLSGTAAQPAFLGLMSGSSSYYFSFIASGAFTGADLHVQNVDGAGMSFANNATVSLSSVSFDLLGVSAGQTVSFMTAQGLTSNVTLSSVSFLTSRSSAGVSAAYNVRVLGADAGLNWTFTGGSGGLWGEAFDSDANNRVTWSAAPVYSGVPPVVVTAVNPASRAQGTSPLLTVTGSRFVSTTTLSLERLDGAGSWAAGATLSPARDFTMAVRLDDDRVLVAGGMHTADASIVLSSTTIYDPSLDSWTAAPSMSTGRHDFELLKLHDGRVLAIGGHAAGLAYQASAEIYDPATNAWSPAGTISRARSAVEGVVLNDGRVLVVGGHDGVVRGDVDLYDPTSGTWTARAPLNVARADVALSVLDDGRVLAAGGVPAVGTSADAEIYNPALDTWTTVAPMLTGRYAARAAKLGDGRVLVLGGSSAGAAQSSAEIFDPVASTWTAAPSMSVARYHPAVTRLGGRVIVAGGYDGTANASVQAFDPATNTWSTLTSFTTPRFQSALVRLADGRLMLIGGEGNAATVISSVELMTVPITSLAATGVLAPSSYTLTGTVNLTGAATGYWDVVARGPGDGRLHGGFRVLAPTLSALSVAPSTVTLAAGAAQGLTATGTYTDGTNGAVNGLLWSSSSTAIASVSGAGVVTGVGAGTTVISVSSGVFTATASVTVTVPPVLASLSVTPGSVTLEAGNQQAFSATGTYDNASTAAFTSLVVWTSSPAAVATISASGVVTAVAAGTAVITASSGAVTSTATVTVSPFPAPTAFAGAALSSTSIRWSWTDDASGELGYRVSSGAANLSGDLAADTTNWLQSALTPNTVYGPYFARVFNSSGTADSTSASRRTLAAAPSGTAVSAFSATAATIAWALNGNPAGLTAEVHKSTDNAAFALFYAAAATGVHDAALIGCTSYYYKVRHINGDAVATAFDATVIVRTADTTPAAPAGLTAEAVAGGRVGLNWVGSPTEGVTGYRLYSDGGTGAFDFGTPAAVFTSTESSWTTGVLASSAAYAFSLRALHRCGVEETAGVLATAASTSTLAEVRASIKNPEAGKKVSGNRVTVMAELTAGIPAQVSQVLFQFRASTTAPWAAIPAANINHPNPDLAAPYFVHWDVGALAQGPYQLRAVAYDGSGNPDPAPGAITVYVDLGAPDIVENVIAGEIRKQQSVNNTVVNTIASGGNDAGDALAKLVLPPGAVNTTTVTVTVETNPTVATAAPSGFSPVGSSLRIDLSNGQHLLSGGQSACITLSYPENVTNPTGLSMMSLDEGTGVWAQDVATTVNSSSRTVTGCTTHFSVFAVFQGLATATLLDGVRLYPNPYKPNSGNRDEGKPFSHGDLTTGIIFDQLPTSVSIDIYSLSGRRVARFETGTSGGLIRWDARNADGRDAASGGYFAVISSPGMKPVVKKFIIIR